VALQVAAGARAPGALGAAAQASPRPRECAGQAATAWDRARAPELDRWCDLLARGFAELASSPSRALEVAGLADEVAPGRAATAVLEGRAAAAAGLFGRAIAAFERARAADPRSLDDPGSLEAWALALEGTGRADEALEAWRSLVTRADVLPGAEARARVLLEAARRALASGPAGLDEAVAWLREARRAGSRERLGEVLATLALALDRAGSHAETAALLGDARRAGLRASVAGATGATGERLAAQALALEAMAPAAARRAWDAYAATGGPWAAHARAHLAALAARAQGKSPQGKKR
jgi:tetratricopeptide (TPR) repeat protein